MRYIITYMMLLYAGIAVSQSYATYTTTQDTVTIGDPIVLKTTVFLSGADPSGVLDFTPLDTINNLLYERDTANFSRYADASLLSGDVFNISRQNKKTALSEIEFSTEQGGLIFQDSIRIAIYDIGIFKIPNPILTLAGQDPVMETQSPVITVILPDNVQKAIQDSIQVAPIKPILKEPMSLEDFRWLLVGLGILLGAVVLVYFFRSKKKSTEEVEIPEEIPPAHVVALEKLKALEKKELWQKGEIKAYQSELTFIIREYLENRYDMLALESTTEEIIRAVPEEVDKSQLRNILQMADLVKFAKAQPPANIHNKFMEQAYQLVRTTKTAETPDD